MILSCPSCATRYRADASTFGAQSRKVRCASCGHVWMAKPEIDAAALPEIQPAAETEPKLPHRAYREKVEQKRKNAIRTAAGGAWGGLGAAVAGVLVCALLFRADIVSAWPQASSAYAAVGIEANPYGVALGDLTITRETEQGLPVIVIEGEIRNIDRRERAAPALRAALLNSNSASVLEWTVLVEGGPMRPGEARNFRTLVSDVPANAVQAEVTLAGLPATPPETTRMADSGHDAPAPEAGHEPESSGHH